MKAHFYYLIIIFIISLQVSAFEVPKNVKALEDKISALNLELSCENADDCLTLPLGYKACGGPDKYIVTSKKNSKLTELKKAIEEYLTADRMWQQKQNIGSGCNVVQAPPTTCQSKKCQQVAPLKKFGH